LKAILLCVVSLAFFAKAEVLNDSSIIIYQVYDTFYNQKKPNSPCEKYDFLIENETTDTLFQYSKCRRLATVQCPETNYHAFEHIFRKGIFTKKFMILPNAKLRTIQFCNCKDGNCEKSRIAFYFYKKINNKYVQLVSTDVKVNE
jgi:hypothetical protein